MDIQSNIDFVGNILPFVLDAVGLVPGLAEAKDAIQIVEDGVTLEKNAYALFESPQADPLRHSLTAFAAQVGVKLDLDPVQQKIIVSPLAGFAPADWNSPVREAQTENPNDPTFVMGAAGGGE